MKRIICFVILITFLSSMFFSFEDLYKYQDKYTTRIFGDPILGWAKQDNEGRILAWRGINATIGYTSKNYFQPLRYEKINWNWSYGTNYVFLPFIGTGFDYYVSEKIFIGFNFTIGPGEALMLYYSPAYIDAFEELFQTYQDYPKGLINAMLWGAVIIYLIPRFQFGISF